METKEIRELIAAFEKSTLSELRYKSGEEQLVFRRGQPATPPDSTPPPRIDTTEAPGAPASSAVAAAENAAAPSAVAENVEHVVSPIVGTFYRTPSPDSPPFVEEGTEVVAGAPLCILEAMKVMNELQADFDLEVVTILAENGQMVEFGTPLFEVRRR